MSHGLNPVPVLLLLFQPGAYSEEKPVIFLS